MKVNTIILACFGPMLLVLSACQQAHIGVQQPAARSDLGEQEEVDLGFPMIRGANPRRSISGLDNSQKRQILAHLRDANVEIADVWFGLLVDNWIPPNMGKKLCVLVIHLNPTVSGEQLRSGKCLLLDEYPWGLGESDQTVRDWWSRGDYVQVSYPDTGFKEGIPPRHNLPFRSNHDELSPAEILEVVHQVRRWGLPTETLNQVRRIDSSTYEVYSATCIQPLVGYGHVIVIRKENGRWRFISNGKWYS